MPSSRVRSLGCLLALVTAAACADSGAASRLAWSGTIDTLPSGAVRVSNPAAGMWDSASAWRAVEELRIGAADGDGPDVFSDVRDVAVDATGRIHVLQSDAKRITVFDSLGRFVRSFGRKGGGPGEFENPVGIQLDPAGRLWVSDPDNARYVAFDSSGALLASHRRTLSRSGAFWEGRFGADGRLVEPDAIRDEDGKGYGDGFVRFDSTFTAADTFLRTPPPDDPNANVFVFRFGEGAAHVAIPFRPGTTTLLDGRGHVWSVDGSDYRLVQRTLDGDTVRVITRAFTPVPVVDADLERFRSAMRKSLPDREYDESRIPKVKPAIQRLVVARDGHLWVHRHLAYGDSATAFDVLDPEGRYLGDVRLPRAIGVHDPLLIDGSTIHAVELDEMEIPQVVRWRIIRP